MLGGIILGSGAAAGVAALSGASALAPLAGVAALWGWVDQKNEATSLVRKLLDGASDRLRGTGGYERHRLLAAAHTTIVAAAYFEVLDEELKRQRLKAKIRDAVRKGGCLEGEA
ncbi:hypothetical protein GCM10010191_29640 [Actinomadura vinacea]|uniref:NACHT N-terminal Helical domain-containing protein n=1 Tax=Actinomadura vinacea TaxID=115336 RepID=A0ABN3J096_9ACTN